jgi:transcription-repair coupling factor (superfamily II helicase)
MSVESSFQTLSERIRQGAPHVRVSGLGGLSVAHTMLEAAKTRPVVAVAKNAVAADDLLRDLRYVAGEERAPRILHLPADERTPFHASSPDPLAVMERTATLYKVVTGQPFDVLVLAPRALARRGLSFEALQRMGEVVAVGAEVDRNALIAKLVVGGYSQVNTVEDPGSFAVRGSIIDVFWPGLSRPVRIDLFGDEVESLKHFDPQSQRTSTALEELSFGPAREVHLDDETVPRARKRLRDLADDVEFPTKRLRELLEDLENRIPFFGIEGLLPALQEKVELPLEVIGHALGDKGFSVFALEPAGLGGEIEELQRDYASHHRQATARGDLCYPPETFVPEVDEVMAGLEAPPRVDLVELLVEGEGEAPLEIRCAPTADLRQEILRETMRRDEVAQAGSHLLDPLARLIQKQKKAGRAVLLPVATLGGVDRLKELLAGHHLAVRHLKDSPDLQDPATRKALHDETVHAWAYVARPTPPASGADLPHMGLTVIAEDEIFGRRARREGSTGRKKGFKTSLSDLEPGDFIVHVEHGIGVFRGLTRLSVRGVEQDYVLLTYAGDDKLYLPVHRINLIQRYAGAEGKKPRIDKLGGTGWKTTRKKVKKAVVAVAQELLNLYAQREMAKRPAHPEPDAHYWEFEAAFPFETTPDQQKAIDEVVSDMTREQPMDRLVCGDVGYGKTEVGMRAAMMAVLGGRQVAVLAPTTVLAQQHFITFTERFKGTPANIEVISRCKKSSEVRDILKRAKEGKVDVLIGTHRILSHDVAFKQLGLVLVDEEQRFGVKAKEALKKLRTNVDILTLTATPIPRTLQMGFFGIRDLSIIESPPVDRRAIRTSIVRFDDDVIREAILRELGRGGQIYFVHNRVRSIGAVADYLHRLVPEARIAIGHGQMEEKQLEDVMLRFMKHEVNLLVCTTIIETGIDVPTANTMFIDHADDFGLAQLYQLRGRVGRSKERAFCYLMIPSSTEHLTPDARKRLEVLQRFSELGAGFQVAQHDLELRGAGDLLGKGQHGHVTAVGYDLYAELLKEAVEELKGRHHDDVPDPDINLPVAAFLPEKYITDMHERLSAYQKLATARDAKEIYDVVGTLGDIHGEPPAEVTALAEVMVIKLRLKEMAARALDIGTAPDAPALGTPESLDGPPPRVVVSLGETSRLDPAKVAAMVEKDPEHIRLTPQGKLIYIPTAQEWRHVSGDVIPLCRVALRRIAEDAGLTSQPAAA